ncbi:hypothetical protein GCM10010440_09000 [Kitasatospora cinereorecta]|uniref:RNA polymerase sigma factor (Sigma-70 family) n=1 Tax=Kitasatospora paracochleata TaxID=58354 RepID=A0ABT1J7H7_9ACTN|nr:RNA polymerase sigma factor (sigma-70 family) [Kitasatospora paracochleata]
MLKQVKGADLVSAVRTVASGQSMLDPATTRKLMESLRHHDESDTGAVLARLTPREREILVLVGEGRTNREIGKELYLAKKTVKNHVSRLLAKLGVERRLQAAVIAAHPDSDQHPGRPH